MGPEAHQNQGLYEREDAWESKQQQQQTTQSKRGEEMKENMFGSGQEALGNAQSASSKHVAARQQQPVQGYRRA